VRQLTVRLGTLVKLIGFFNGASFGHDFKSQLVFVLVACYCICSVVLDALTLRLVLRATYSSIFGSWRPVYHIFLLNAILLLIRQIWLYVLERISPDVLHLLKEARAIEELGS
jgi:hypothetical protein